jgi:hypothetical protein
VYIARLNGCPKNQEEVYGQQGFCHASAGRDSLFDFVDHRAGHRWLLFFRFAPFHRMIHK